MKKTTLRMRVAHGSLGPWQHCGFGLLIWLMSMLPLGAWHWLKASLTDRLISTLRLILLLKTRSSSGEPRPDYQ